MSRAAIYDSLIADPDLNSLGLVEDTIEVNWNNDERPSSTGIFAILRWGPQGAPLFGGDVKAPESLAIWVHIPRELNGSDFGPLIKALDQFDETLSDLRDVAGQDGYTLSFVRVGDRSGDLVDDGFNTITKWANYQVYSRKS